MLVTQDFAGKIFGRAGLFFEDQSGTTLVHLLMEEDEMSSETQEVLFEILLEVGDIVLNGVVGSLSNMACDHLCYSVPRISVGPEIIQGFSKVASISGDNECANLVIRVEFNSSGHQIQGSLFIVFDLQTVRSILIEQLFA
jgi:chemotaxis protein CheC